MGKVVRGILDSLETVTIPRDRRHRRAVTPRDKGGCTGVTDKEVRAGASSRDAQLIRGSLFMVLTKRQYTHSFCVHLHVGFSS